MEINCVRESDSSNPRRASRAFMRRNIRSAAAKIARRQPSQAFVTKRDATRFASRAAGARALSAARAAGIARREFH
jgi:hypothetical protein